MTVSGSHLFVSFAQFNCKNTLDDQILEDVTVAIETGDDFEVAASIPCPKLVFNVPGTTYTVVQISDDPTSGQYLFLNLRYSSRGPSLNSTQTAQENMRTGENVP